MHAYMHTYLYTLYIVYNPKVDAAIVRTMKSRKQLLHTRLMSELLVQLRFPAQTADIKKRIEGLIEINYLERDKDQPYYYSYLA